MRQQGVFLALDVAPVATRKPPVFALANRIQGLAQMAHDMELVEQNRGPDSQGAASGPGAAFAAKKSPGSSQPGRAGARSGADLSRRSRGAFTI